MKKLLFSAVAALALLVGPVVAQTTIPGTVGEATTTNPAVEIAFWDSIKDSDDPMLYLAYLEQFPDGAFRVIAKTKMTALWQKAIDAFAQLEEMGMSGDGATGGMPEPTPPVVTPAPTPPIIVQPAPTPPVVIKPAPTTPRPAANRTLTRNTQNQLQKHGCYTGGVDGVWGPASRAAMRKFNRRAGTSFQTATPTKQAVDYMRSLSQSNVRICN